MVFEPYSAVRKLVGVALLAGKVTVTVIWFVAAVPGVVWATVTFAADCTQLGSSALRVDEAFAAVRRLVAIRRATSRVACPAVAFV